MKTKLFDDLTRYQQYFAVAFLLGFLGKYNYLLLFIHQVPCITGLIFKNIILLFFLYYFILPLIKNANGRITILSLFFVFSVFFLSSIWYNRYFGNYLSMSDMLMGQGIRPFKVLLIQLIRYYDIYFLLDVILICYVTLKDKTSIPLKSIFSSEYRSRIKNVAFCLVVLLAAQVLTTNYILGNQNPISLYFKSTSSFVNVYGIIPLYVFETLSFYYPAEQNGSDVSPPSSDEKLTDKEEKKEGADIQNIIVIQVESLDRNIIDFEHQGVEITPFLNSLRQESLFYNNFYAQHVNGSFDAEFSFLTSVYPLNKTYGFKVYDLTRFTSLVQILKDMDYTTLAFHGNDKEFFHRHKAFPELGFDAFYSKEDFSFDDALMRGRYNTFGINDYDFFLQSLDYLQDVDSPFFAFFITATSHTPFDFYPSEHARTRFQDINNPLVRDYFRSISFVDKSLQMFFRKLKEMDFYEDTLFIIYSDHESGVEGTVYDSTRNFDLQRRVKPPENIPLFLIHPDIEPDIITKEGTTTDLAPTILGLLGEDEKPEEFLGHSLLKKEENPVYFMHEIPQILHHGQLFALLPTGIEKIGYVEDEGERDIEPPKEEQLTDIIEYTQDLNVERRVRSD
ncbi:MAG: LTA synthase family protein [Desulfovermiculus sp.]